MRSNCLMVVLAGAVLIPGCGSADQEPTVRTNWASTSSPDTVQVAGESLFSNPGADAVAFTTVGANTTLEVNLDGSGLQHRATSDGGERSLTMQEQILSNACGGGTGSTELAFLVVSPDGAATGSAMSDWDPAWSPDGSTVAVACAVDDSGRVMIVQGEQPADGTESWSRAGNGDLSDLIDVYLVTADGSHLRNLTDPTIAGTGGDWLPRWSSDGRFIVFESNREGNSDIFVAEVDSPVVTRLTTHSADDQSPAWSRDNNFIVFSSNRSGSFEMYAIAQVGGDPFPVGLAGRPVPWDH